MASVERIGKAGTLCRIEDWVIELPIRATYAADEVADANEEAKARQVFLRRVLFERAEAAVVEALQVGRTQYEGALIVVESRQREGGRELLSQAFPPILPPETHEDSVDEVCDECGETIPNMDYGSLDNKHHKESCSLFNPRQD